MKGNVLCIILNHYPYSWMGCFENITSGLSVKTFYLNPFYRLNRLWIKRHSVMYRKRPPARISYVNEGMLCKIKTKGRRQDGNKSGSGRVLWQISWWMEANCAIHQRTRLVECFKIGIQLKIPKLWIYFFFLFCCPWKRWDAKQLHRDHQTNN